MEAGVKMVTEKMMQALEEEECVELDEVKGKIVGLVDAMKRWVGFGSEE